MKPIIYLFVFILGCFAVKLLSGSHVYAQGNGRRPFDDTDYVNNYACRVSVLPESMHVREQTITVFADFDHPRKGRRGMVVPLFVANRTSAKIEATWNPYGFNLRPCPIEVEIREGVWKRVEFWHHIYTGIVSDEQASILPGENYYFGKTLPAGGPVYNVRFRFFVSEMGGGSVISNVGKLPVDQKLIDSVLTDDFQILHGDSEFVAGVLTGKIPLPRHDKCDTLWSIETAAARLAKDFYCSGTLNLLKQILYDENRTITWRNGVYLALFDVKTPASTKIIEEFNKNNEELAYGYFVRCFGL